MTYLKMATLAFPVSMCLGLGLYAELFLFSALKRLQRSWRKRVFQLKNLKAHCVRIAVSQKNSHITNIFLCSKYCKFLTSMQFQSYLNIIGKGEAFPGLLFHIILTKNNEFFLKLTKRFITQAKKTWSRKQTPLTCPQGVLKKPGLGPTVEWGEN